jgi:uncharacterized protein involved in outer membrane biogenesis
MSSRRKIWAWVTVAVVITVAFIFLALPPLLKHFAVKNIEESTGRKSRIERVSLNPFTLTAEIGGVSLSEKGSSATFLSLSSARISLSPLSLPKRSFIVTEVRISSPYLHIVRDAPFHYNFSDLVTPKKEEPQKKEGTPLYSLNNIVISNASVDFVDRALNKEKSHRITKMAVSIPIVSNMPYLADRYVTPHFSAVINDSPVDFSGQLKPLTKAVEATISVKLSKVDLPYYLGYLPFPPPVQVPSGRLSTELEVGYLVHAKTGPELRVSGTAALEHFAVKELNGAPLASLDRAELKIRQAALISRSVEISSLAVEGVELTAARDSAGKWNLQRALASQGAAGQRPHPLPLSRRARGSGYGNQKQRKQRQTAGSKGGFALGEGEGALRRPGATQWIQLRAAGPDRFRAGFLKRAGT